MAASDIDLSGPRSKELKVKLGPKNTVHLKLRRVRLSEAEAFDNDVKKLSEKLHSGKISGIKYSLELLKLRCEDFDPESLGDLYEDQLTAILSKLGELQSSPYPEGAEKKTQ